MRYFLTGATGFIGGRVAHQLREAGHDVIALARNPDKATSLTEAGVTIAQGDITDKDSLKTPMTGVDGVFHMAAWYEIGAKDNSMAETINVTGTRNVLEVMRDLNIPKGVYTSTLAVFSDTNDKVVDETYRHDGPWLSEYDKTKWKAHYEVALPMMKEGLPLVIVQPGVNYGPGDTSAIRKTFLEFLKGQLPMTPAKTAYCWAHVDDTARAHLLAMERGKIGESYITAGPVHTLINAFEIASKISGVPAPQMHPAPATMQALASVVKLLEKFVPLPDTYRSESLRVVAGATYLGTSAKAERELGWSARSLEEGLTETLKVEMEALGMSMPKA